MDIELLKGLVVDTLQRCPNLPSEFMSFDQIAAHDAACVAVYRQTGHVYNRIIPLRGYSANGYTRQWVDVLRPILQQIAHRPRWAWKQNKMETEMQFYPSPMVLQLWALVATEISKHQDPEYWGTNEDLAGENKVLALARDAFGYDVEQDDAAMEYFQKSTRPEIWQYWLDTILPKLGD